MDLSSVKERLTANPYFNYRGDPDVSMLRPSEVLIECRGAAFIDRASFSSMRAGSSRSSSCSTRADRSLLVYTRLVEKYGQPSALSPEETAWESETVRFSVERPLSVKYVDRAVLMKLRAAPKCRNPSAPNS
jgi:hypothetical protein